MVDQVLLRLLLFGLAAGIISGIYAWVRQIRPAWLGIRTRRLIWLIILLLPVFALPWPWPVVVPVETPAWIYEGRLPNPAASFPSTQLTREADQAWKERMGRQTVTNIFFEPIGEAVAETSEETSVVTADADADASGKVSTSESSATATSESEMVRRALATANHMIGTIRMRTTPGFWLLDLLSWIRWLYLFGFVANLGYKLIQLLRAGRRYRGNNPGTVLIENPGWLQELAEIRDRTGQYRQGIPIDATWPSGLFWQQVNAQARHHLFLRSSDLESQSDQQRWLTLALSLDRIHHPDTLIFLLYRISSSLFWFTPVAWLPERFFLEDQDLWRQRRITSTQLAPAHFTSPQLVSSHMASVQTDQPTQARHATQAVLGLLILSLIFLAIWQNPADVRPDIRQAIIRQEMNQVTGDDPDSLEVVHTPFYSHGEGSLEFTYGISTNASMAVAGELLSYRLFLNDLAGSEPGNSGVFVLDESGLPRWQLDLNTLPVLSNPDSRKQVFYLINSRQLADGSYQAFGLIADYASGETGTKILLTISAEGILQSWTVIPTNIAESDLGQITILQDGSLLLVESEVVTQFDPWQPYFSSTPSGQTDAVHIVQNRVNRYHSVGTPVWSAKVVSDLNDALQLGAWHANMTYAERRISKILPADDGGCYLVIRESLMIQTDFMNLDLARFPGFSTSSYFNDSLTRYLPREHQTSDEIVRISPTGSLLWRSSWPTSASQLRIEQCIAGSDGRLYYAALLQNRSVQQLLPSALDFYVRRQSAARYSESQAEEGPYDGTGPVYPIHEPYRQLVLVALDGDGQFIWKQDLYLEDGAESVNLAMTDDCLTVLAVRNTMRMLLFSSIVPPKANESELSSRMVWQYDLEGDFLGRAELPSDKPRDPQDHAQHLFIRKGIIAVPDSEYGQAVYD